MAVDMISPDSRWLAGLVPSDSSILHNVEQGLWKLSESLERDTALRLLHEVRRLMHEQRDPNYLYAESRIHRSAILAREQTIDNLQERIRQLEREMEDRGWIDDC